MKQNALDILKEKGLSNTGPRKRILEILIGHKGPLSASEVYQKLEFEGLCHNESTVYRNLQKFLEADMIQTFTLNDGIARFEFKKGHHHHIVCIKCKKMDCLNLCQIEKLFDETIKNHGFMPVSHNLEFYGLCKSCSTAPLK